MRFPSHIATDMARLQLKNAARGRARYPFVLMLEPLWTCNLACLGCSKERHTGKLKDRLPVDACLRALDDCEAINVSICGGESTLYPELPELIEGIIARRAHIYLCTNGLLLDTTVFGKIAPHKRLSINVHLDGMRETHDYVTDRRGVFDKAVAMIREAKALGYHVLTNTTVFRETEIAEIEELCRYLAELDVDGMLIAPGYQYESVQHDIFLSRREMERKFAHILEMSKRYRITSTPLYLEFVAGLRDYKCSPWSTVTYTPRGWKGPCYLLERRYTHSWDEFWDGTDWDYWESRQDDACQQCKMHSGFEASAVVEARKRPKDLIRLMAWNLAG
jgi:hopanoid biosynthesis associated radical SAM protein HpnH